MPETLNIENAHELVAYLRQTGRIAADELPSVTTLTGGVSNRAVWVQLAGGEAWVLKQALPKLRVALDWFSSPERVHREALALRWLVKLAPAGATVALVFEDHEHHVIAMQAVPRPHDNWKVLLLAGHVSPSLVEQFGTLLGTIHRRGQEAGPELRTAFEDRSFFESLRLDPYYQTAAERNPQAAGFLSELAAETRSTRLTFVHGDYSPKNILVHQKKLVLLDHEVAHFGDPAFDLGFALAHLLSKAHHLPAQRPAFVEAASGFWTSYRRAAGQLSQAPGFDTRVVRHALACLLARVDGRSPLEYLTPEERNRQRSVVLHLMTRVPSEPGELGKSFAQALPTHQ